MVSEREIEMCSKCSNTGIIGWTDITINWDDGASVALRRPELCRCSKAMELFIEWNKIYIKSITKAVKVD